MNIVFTGMDLFKFGMILYVLTWVGFVCYLNIYSRRKTQNVHKVAMWYFITVATRHWGWCAALVVGFMLTLVLPDVYVVTQDTERKIAEIEAQKKKWSWYSDTTYTAKGTFYADRYFVPFSYKGRRYAAFGKYLLNESGSVIALYTTHFFNGRFTRVSDVEVIIPPGNYCKLGTGIDNKFESPVETSLIYVPEKKKNKHETQLTVTLLPEAILDIERIRRKIRKIDEMIMESARIKKRDEMIYHWIMKDSLIGPNFQRVALPKELKISEDAEQGAHRK